MVGHAFGVASAELLRSLADFRNVVNGLILVVIVLFLPRGLWDPARVRALLGRRR